MAALLTSAACEEPARDHAALQTAHCHATLSWMTKGLAQVDVVETDHWLVEGVRNVTIAYDVASVRGREPERDVILCRYAARPESDALKASGMRAQAIQIRGAWLSEKQVQTINVTISLAGTAR